MKNVGNDGRVDGEKAIETSADSGLLGAAEDRRQKAFWFLVIFFVGLAVRVLSVWPLLGTPLLEIVMGDALNYVARAKEVAAGDWIGETVFYQAPLYHYFLGLQYVSFGMDDRFVRGLQILLSSLSCGFLMLAVWRWISKPAGIVVGFILSFHSAAIFSALTLQKSVLDIFFVCTLLWLLVLMRDRPGTRKALVMGCTMGLFILNRENVQLWLIVLVPWFWLALKGNSWQKFSWSTALVVGVLAILLPVAARNASISGELHLTTSQFGHNFYIGNNPNADGTYRPLVAYRGDPRVEQADAIEIAEKTEGRSLSPAEVSDFYTQRAIDYIRSEPLDWLALMVRKMGLTFNAVEWVDTKDLYSFAARSPVLALGDWISHYGVIFPLAALGLIVTWPMRKKIWILYVLFCVYTASLLLFYIFGRYRLPTTPIVMIFAGSGLVMVRAYTMSHSPRTLMLTFIVVMAVALGANWPMSDKHYMRSVTEYNVGNELYVVGESESAKAHYREAIRLYPGNALANLNLGAVIAMEGEPAVALAHFDRALEIDSDLSEAHLNRARALGDLGETERSLMSYAEAFAGGANSSELLLEMGQANERARRDRKALFYFEEALRRDPTNPVARQAIFRIRSRLGRGD